MDVKKVLTTLKYFFPGSFVRGSGFLETQGGKLMLNRFREMSDKPIHVTHFNQMLHFVHEAGVTDDFFKYYFLTQPSNHSYSVDKVMEAMPGLHEKGICSLSQLEWGIRRLFTDGLLYFGDIRAAFSKLRVMGYSELERFFWAQRYDSEGMRARGEPLPLVEIPVDDRYLISEVACKAYSAKKEGAPLLIEKMLLDAYREHGGGRVRIGVLFDENSSLGTHDPHAQMMLKFAAEEIMAKTVENEEQIRQHVAAIAKRFTLAREHALENTRRYLSLANELDVYVATSMRKRADFRSMASDCKYIFDQEGLKRFGIRYFNPTTSAAEGHEDKGLIECLMVKCAKALLYFAGEADSFGKDAEVTMAMSLGKPVVILCPGDEKGSHRMRFFRDMHPLSRMIEFKTGIACGAMVTQDRGAAAKLLERIFDNSMEYDLHHEGDGYFRLRDRLTQSVVRLQTNSRMLRETFANYYYGVPEPR